MKLINKVLRRAIGYPLMPAYIHIPKTGGTYLAQHESNKEPVIWPITYLGHISVVEKSRKDLPVFPPSGFRLKHTISEKEISKYFVFSTVRNIFDWLVSYTGHAGGWNPRYVDTDHYDYKNAQKGFEYLLKTVANRDEPWPSRKLIHYQIFCNNGNLVVDWLNRNETLDEGLKDLAQYLKINHQRKKKQRLGVRKDYRSYFNDSLIDLVYETWGRELKLFGYGFDSQDISSALLKRTIDKSKKQKVKYYWSDDKLLFDGREIR